VFNFLSSVRFAIPLLMAIAAASIAGSLIPQGKNVQLSSDTPMWVIRLNDHLQLNDIFHSWWYILLLGLLGLSLLTIALKRFPTAYKQRGRGAGLGVLLSHLGILLILVGMVYGGLSGFRYYTRLVEGDVTVLPPLPFVIKLNKFKLKYYPEETFRHLGPNARFTEQQDSMITLFHHGNPFLETTIAPGRPVTTRGVTLLPSEKDIGWVFNLVITDPNGREKVVPIRPWAPPLISMAGGAHRYMAHRLTYQQPYKEGDEASSPVATTEIFRLKSDGTAESLGFATEKEPLKIGAYTASIESIRPYTGLHVYRRPEKPFLIAGFITLSAGLFMSFSRRRPKVNQNTKRKSS
jgi:cytochrome c biogenesis protein